tara:strand:+ start:595 stop:3699 length:3105 start_codon:yes stop_codon:yes gene_type:complete
MSLTNETEAIFDIITNKYKFKDTITNGTPTYTYADTLRIGLGVYRITDILKNRPIAFKIEDNDYIEFNGFEQNKMLSNNILNPDFRIETQYYNYIDSDNNMYNFYSGNVALKVTGNFGEISGYYILKEGTTQNSGVYNGLNINNGDVEFINQKIIFESSNSNGSKLHNYLEIKEFNLKRLIYNFNYDGLKINGLAIKSRDKINSNNVVYYSYIKSYLDTVNYNCFYISSNGIPNHHSFLIENEINNTNNPLINNNLDQIHLYNYTWKITNFRTLKVYNYGIDRQSYGYRNNSNKLFGKAFKIPINIIQTDIKKIPEDLYLKENTPFFKETFWYKNNKNWKEIMTDRNYESINLGLGKPNSLLPLGPIGVAVNGIPFYNHFEMTDEINNFKIVNLEERIVDREITLKNINYQRNDKVIELNYDNTGGTIDKNFSYHYNKYPVALEAMIKIGTVQDDSGNYAHNKIFLGENGIPDFSLTINEKVEFLYLNVSNSSFIDYSFSFTITNSTLSQENIDLLNRRLNFVGIPGKSIGAYISLDLRDYINYIKNDENITNTGGNKVAVFQAIKDTNIYNSNFTFNWQNSSNNQGLVLTNKFIYKTLKLNTSNNVTRIIAGYDFIENDFTYKGYFTNINKDDVRKNDIYNFLNNIVAIGNRNLGDEFNPNYQWRDWAHSPILGWAFDGYPIYGQIGYKNDNDKTLVLLKSSYENGLYKQRYIDKYVQDPEYLDLCNGRYSATPEFPEGIYHYVCTINNTSQNYININNTRRKDLTIYAYPYIMGAYKGIPEIENFSLPNINSTSSNSNTGNDYETQNSTNIGNSSQLLVKNNTNYEINFRTIKSNNDNLFSNFTNSVDVIQNQNHIILQQSSKPYIYNFSSNLETSIYGGEDINYFGNKVSLLANTPTTYNYLKCYGTVYKFKYFGNLNLGDCVKFKSDTLTSTELLIEKCDNDNPILGVVIRINGQVCFVCVKGLCEVNTVNGLSTDNINNPLKLVNSKISIYDHTVVESSQKNYILGNYIRKNNINSNHLININPQIVFG